MDKNIIKIIQETIIQSFSVREEINTEQLKLKDNCISFKDEKKGSFVLPISSLTLADAGPGRREPFPFSVYLFIIIGLTALFIPGGQLGGFCSLLFGAALGFCITLKNTNEKDNLNLYLNDGRHISIAFKNKGFLNQTLKTLSEYISQAKTEETVIHIGRGTIRPSGSEGRWDGRRILSTGRPLGSSNSDDASTGNSYSSRPSIGSSSSIDWEMLRDAALKLLTELPPDSPEFRVSCLLLRSIAGKDAGQLISRIQESSLTLRSAQFKKSAGPFLSDFIDSVLDGSTN